MTKHLGDHYDILFYFVYLLEGNNPSLNKCNWKP